VASVSAIHKQTEKIITHVLAINPLLAINLEVPGVGSLEEGLVLGVLEVKMLELVGLPVRGDVNDRLNILATGNQDTTDDRVVGLAKDTHRTEEVLAGSLKTVEEAADQVRRHEGLGQLVVVLKINTPDGKAILVEADKKSALRVLA
jgi:hypothetical protein